MASIAEVKEDMPIKEISILRNTTSYISIFLRIIDTKNEGTARIDYH